MLFFTFTINCDSNVSPTRQAGCGVHPLEQLAHTQLSAVVCVARQHDLTHLHFSGVSVSLLTGLDRDGALRRVCLDLRCHGSAAGTRNRKVLFWRAELGRCPNANYKIWSLHQFIRKENIIGPDSPLRKTKKQNIKYTKTYLCMFVIMISLSKFSVHSVIMWYWNIISSNNLPLALCLRKSSVPQPPIKICTNATITDWISTCIFKLHATFNKVNI